MRFEEFSALSCQDISRVQVDVLKADVGCLRQLFDFRDFDHAKETLVMLKPIYGLNDAPRAWGMKLDQVLNQWLSRRQFHFGPGLHCVHRQDEVEKEHMHARAQQNTMRSDTGQAISETHSRMLTYQVIFSVCSVSTWMILRVRRVRRQLSHC